MMKPGHALDEVKSTISQYIQRQNEASPKWKVSEFKFYPLKGLPSHREEIVSAVSNGAHPSGLLALGVIALLLLLLASFNYMNVAVATVATRLKEIGIRKVIGGRKKEIVSQFLTENFLLCTFALAIGTLLAYWVFLPGLNALFPITVPFAFSSGNAMFFFFGALLLFIGFVSGAYPAFYISSFSPIKILRGREKFGQRSWLSRSLLTVQFVIAFTTIVGAFVFIDNSLYLKNKDWGYDQHQAIGVPTIDNEKYLALRDRVAALKTVETFAGAESHIGYTNPRTTIDYLEQRYQVVNYRVGFDYLETMNLRLKDGRLFDRSIQSDQIESVIINERLADKLNWEDPIGKSFDHDSTKRYVIGVVENFHYDGFYNPIEPVIFTVAPDSSLNYLVVKTQVGSTAETDASIREIWKTVAPDDPYEGFLQNDVFADFHRDNNSNMKLLGTISAMAVVLACLGLFGLVAFNITRRLKEFSIRKVFGANLPHIFRLMNRDYLWILLIAFVIGAPAGFFLMNNLIQHIYPDPQTAGPVPFIMAIGLMALTVGLTVGSQLRRVAKENPSVTLRND
ncbi:MAG: FtsX-like permease family protein [Cyclobacteriaceae bacterium]